MRTGLLRLLSRRLARSEGSGPRLIAGLLVIAALGGGAAWLLREAEEDDVADGVLRSLAGSSTMASVDGEAANLDGASPGSDGAASSAPMTARAAAGRQQASLAPAAADDGMMVRVPRPVEGLRIGAQSWRRGGLGARALVTFTVRNGNPYPVKDVAIACAFDRRDGGHVTSRSRMLPGTIGPRSRRTYAAVHVGFVNVNASNAVCKLVTASKN